jgi:hypothetical protein
MQWQRNRDHQEGPEECPAVLLLITGDKKEKQGFFQILQ